MWWATTFKRHEYKILHIVGDKTGGLLKEKLYPFVIKFSRKICIF